MKGYPPSSKTNSWLMSGIGSLTNVGGCGVPVCSGVPVLEKAPDLVRNSERAATPFFVPRMTGREMYLEAFLRMYL